MTARFRFVKHFSNISLSIHSPQWRRSSGSAKPPKVSCGWRNPRLRASHGSNHVDAFSGVHCTSCGTRVSPVELAETEGFEPSMELLTPYSLSRGAPSASRASLREKLRSDTARFGAGAKHNGSPRARQTICVSRRSGVGILARIVSGLFAALDSLVDLFAVHSDIFRCSNSDTHLVALDAEHGDSHRVADHQGLTDATRQDQHLTSPMTGRSTAGKWALPGAPPVLYTNVNHLSGRSNVTATAEGHYSRSAKLAFDPTCNARQRLDQRRAIIAAALGHVGTTTALAVDLTGHMRQ